MNAGVDFLLEKLSKLSSFILWECYLYLLTEKNVMLESLTSNGEGC